MIIQCLWYQTSVQPNRSINRSIYKLNKNKQTSHQSINQPIKIVYVVFWQRGISFLCRSSSFLCVNKSIKSSNQTIRQSINQSIHLTINVHCFRVVNCQRIVSSKLNERQSEIKLLNYWFTLYHVCCFEWFDLAVHCRYRAVVGKI